MNILRVIPCRGRSMHNSNLFEYYTKQSPKDYTVGVVTSGGIEYIVQYRYLRSFVADISTITDVITILDGRTGIAIYEKYPKVDLDTLIA